MKKWKSQEITEILQKIEKATFNCTLPVVTHVRNTTRDPFKILISTMLSLRTKDSLTYKISSRLFEKVKTPSDILALSENELEKIIYPVGFYKTKAKNIIATCKILVKKYKGEVPKTREELLKLPGVGRKTTNLVLGLGFGIPAICVDTHVHRISNRLGVVSTSNPFETELELEKVLPKNLWIKYNDIMVKFGQNICRPLSPFCSKCPITQKCLYFKNGKIKR